MLIRLAALLAIAACATPAPPLPRGPIGAAPVASPDAVPPPTPDAGPPLDPAAPPPPIAAAARLPVQPVAVVGDLVPWTWLDRVEGTCGYRRITHVEGIDLATGAARWTAPAWGQLLGQLPDGDLVVASGSEVAVLRRADGALRYRCAPPADSRGDEVDWRQDADGLHGDPFDVRAPSGAAQRYELPGPTPFRVTLAADRCTSVAADGSQVVRPRLPSPPLTYAAGAWTVRVDQRGQPMPHAAPPSDLVGETGGRVRWRRAMTQPYGGPCALP